MKEANRFSILVDETRGTCAVGERQGLQNQGEGKIPVISCEGGCIRGEIARLAANLVAREEPYRRGCHGELFTVPASAIARWMKGASKVVVIDGCFLKCHARIVRNLIAEEQIAEFDALSMYGKYTDLFDVEAVPEEERLRTARGVADRVLADMACEGRKAGTACGCAGSCAAPA